MLISDFLIKGNIIEGEIIQIYYNKSKYINFNYSWEIYDNNAWILVSNNDQYKIKKNDVNKKLRYIIKYLDKDNYLQRIVSKSLIVQDKFTLLEIYGKDDTISLKFNRKAIVSSNLKVYLSNDTIAKYIIEPPSNIIKCKIVNYQNNKRDIYIDSINSDIVDENNLSIENRFKNIIVNRSAPKLKVLKNINSFNKKNSVALLFTSNKYGKLVYDGIVNDDLPKHVIIGLNTINFTNLKDDNYNIKLRVIDMTGNLSDFLVVNPFTIWTKELKLDKVSLRSSNKDNKLAKAGDIIKLIIEANEFIKISKIKVMREYIPLSKLINNEFEYKIKADDVGNLKFNITFLDRNNMIYNCNETTDDSYITIDNVKPNIKDIKLKSTSNDNSLNRNDSISLDVTFDKDVIPEIFIFDKIAAIENTGDHKFRATLDINNLDNLDYDNVYLINFKGFNGLGGEPFKSKKNPFNIYLDKPNLKEIKKIGVTYDKSPVYIFNSSQDGKILLSNNLNSDISYVRKGNNCIKINNLQEGKYNEYLEVKNNLGNTTRLDISEFKIINDENKFEVLNLSMISDNENNKIATIGNIITIMFTTNKPVKNIDIDLEVNGRIIKLDKKIQNIFNECFWIINFEVTPKIPYGDIIFKLSITDKNDYILNISNKTFNTNMTITNLNYENFKTQFLSIQNNLDSISSYFNKLKLQHLDSMINIVENNIFSSMTLFIWQERINGRWKDIKSSNNLNFEINESDYDKIIRIKMYFIDSNKRINLKYSEEFKFDDKININKI